MLTVEISMMHWQGLTELAPKSYTPLALMNEDPPGVSVSGSSPYKTVKELADAIKAAPVGKMKASGTGQGGIWHLALVGWLKAMGLAANHVAWVPSNGAAPAMQDLAAGGLDLCTCSIPEARAIIEAGKARALAIMAPERNPVFKDIPTLKEAVGIDYSIGAWRGIAGPKGLPPEIATKLTATLKKVYDSKEFKDFMSNRGFGTVWGDAAAVRQVHGRGRRQDGRRHEGRGAGEDVTSETRRARERPPLSDHALGDRRTSVAGRCGVFMRLPDRATGLFLVGLGSLAAYGGWLLPPVPGQPVGPNVFPLVIGIGLAICGLMIAFGIGHSFEEEEELVPLEAGQQAPPPRGRLYGLRALFPPLLLLFYVVAADRLGFILTAGFIVLVTSTALGARPKLSVPLAILAPIGIHLIFAKVLRVPLPIGLIPMPW